jgi:predicted GH43/DUF377 family glycosyl hydrolase
MTERADLRRHDVLLVPRSERVLLRPFVPSDTYQITAVLARVLTLDETRVEQELASLLLDFSARHIDIEHRLLTHYDSVASRIVNPRSLSRARKTLIGALFSGEYALESAALFNPSIVPHPDQRGVAAGALRFVMSLRATGEGHVSSIELRSGLIDSTGAISMDPVSPHVSSPEIDPDPRYEKERFANVIKEMGSDGRHAGTLMDMLEDVFPKSELKRCIRRVRKEKRHSGQEYQEMLQKAQWIADSNYDISFSPTLSLDERVIFPMSANESNGIEDARFVLLREDDGSATYFATYTAYNGRTVLPQIIETSDFIDFRVRTCSGNAVRNKGMALFPRRINGRYAMLSRQDGENLFFMTSDRVDHWSDPQVIMRPTELWEASKIGNCGSPLETEAGWLVITHGVGPMRRYCIGAALLDLNDPSVVLGRLRDPLLEPEGAGREGYVPNVVYSCGGMIHLRDLILPYAMSDRTTSIVSIPVATLLTELLGSPSEKRGVKRRTTWKR